MQVAPAALGGVAVLQYHGACSAGGWFFLGAKKNGQNWRNLGIRGYLP